MEGMLKMAEWSPTASVIAAWPMRLIYYNVVAYKVNKQHRNDGAGLQQLSLVSVPLATLRTDNQDSSTSLCKKVKVVPVFFSK
jgi:hypothetical protein